MDGWHVIQGERLYVENGRITRAVKKDRNGGDVPAGVYRWNKSLGCYVIESGLTIPAFRAGYKRGTIIVK